jgi:uncharacterized membrane protein (UPF0127 family)
VTAVALHAVVLASFLTSLTAPVAHADGARRVIEARPLDEFPRERIAIETRSARRFVFDAWLADSDDTRAQGLMFVQSIEPTQAMIFVYDTPQGVSMWMKNTYIPLDMLFADEAGCIVKVAANAKPLSLETIATQTPVAIVVEIKGGTAAEHGIGVGDRVVRLESGRDARAVTRACTH